MVETNHREVHVEWDTPRGVDEVLKRAGPGDYGLYQVYAHHIVFGPGSLVYIGRTTDQTFAQRFEQHLARWLDRENDVRVRLGRLRNDCYRGDADWKKLVRSAEALAIYWHSPPYNAKCISSYDGGPIRVFNWGNRGSILPEFSSHWMPPRPSEDE